MLLTIEKGVSVLKIHVVQKGETLWKIAQKYGVDFEQVKQLNTQLSNPDMVMPGMKIKIPSTTKQVTKEVPVQKEVEQYPAKHPYKEMPTKTMPVIKEDDTMPPPKEMPMQPVMQQMPMMEQQMENYYTTVNIPQMPHYQQPKSEHKPKEKKKMPEKHEMPQMMPTQMPEKHEMPQTMPAQMPKQQEMPQTMPAQMPIAPMYYHPMPYCVPVNHAPAQHSGYPMGGEMTHSNMYYNEEMPDCEDKQHAPNNYAYPEMFQEQNWMESPSDINMPQMPHHLAGMKDDCSCHHQPAPMHGYYRGGYAQQPPFQPQPGGYGYAQSPMQRPEEYPHAQGVYPGEQLGYNGQPFQQPAPYGYSSPQQPEGMVYPSYPRDDDDEEGNE